MVRSLSLAAETDRSSVWNRRRRSSTPITGPLQRVLVQELLRRVVVGEGGVVLSGKPGHPVGEENGVVVPSKQLYIREIKNNNLVLNEYKDLSFHINNLSKKFYVKGRVPLVAGPPT